MPFSKIDLELENDFKSFLEDVIPKKEKGNEIIVNLPELFSKIDGGHLEEHVKVETKAMLLIKLYGIMRSEQLYRLKVEDVKCSINEDKDIDTHYQPKSHCDLSDNVLVSASSQI